MSLPPESIETGPLLALANQYITRHDDYLPAMTVTGVRQHGELLIFSGPVFTDDQGLPTLQTTAVFNVLKFLTLNLSPLYRLK